MTDLSKSFWLRKGRECSSVISRLSFAVRRGGFATFFGPNGCGKTTLFNIIAGLERADEGTVDIFGVAPGHAETGYIFQNYQATLFPWRTVLDNIAFPLEVAGMAKRDRRARAEHTVRDLGFELPLAAFPYQLSGGEQQKTALARALVVSPEVLLLDEPFSALDHTTSEEMMLTIRRIWRETGTTMLMISHDIEQAIFLGEVLFVLNSSPMSAARAFSISTADAERPMSFMLTPAFQEVRGAALAALGEVGNGP